MERLGQPRIQRTACRRCHARKVRCDATSDQPCSGCRYSGTPCIAHEKRRRNRGPPKPTALATLLPTPAPAEPSTAQAATRAALASLPRNMQLDRQGIAQAATRDTCPSSDERDSEVGRVAAALSSLHDASWQEPGEPGQPEPGQYAGVGGRATRTRRVANRAEKRAPNEPLRLGRDDDGGPAGDDASADVPLGDEATAADSPTYAAMMDESGGSDDAPTTTTTPADVKRHLVEMLSQDDIADRVMQRGVRIVYVGQEYSNIHYLIRQRARNAPPSVHHFPSNQISRRYTSHEYDRIPRQAFVLPAPAVVDELLDAYFRHVHPGFPVLDEAVFMNQYRSRDPFNPPSLLVLQAVLMVGAHVCEHRPDRMALKTSFFRKAKMLFDARFEWNRDVVVQAALLMTWHSEGVEDIGANSYYWVGIAARTALGLGMHRDARSSTLICQDQRLWRRLWWILVQLDAIVSLSYGRPPALRLDESDVPELRLEDCEPALPVPPGNGATDAGHDLSDDSNASAAAAAAATSISSPIDFDFMIHQTRLCCIIAHTLRERFGLRVTRERRRAALAEADQRLVQWMAELPPSLRHPLVGHSSTSQQTVDGGYPASTTPWVAALHMTYNNFLILMHRPPPPQPMTTFAATVTSQDDMGICSTAATAMVHLLEGVSARRELRLLNFFAVDAVFTTLIQLSAEIRVTNPILAAHAMRRFDIAMDILRRLAAYWLNAEIVLRLFEDSSERLKSQLAIGKSGASMGTSSVVSDTLDTDNSQSPSSIAAAASPPVPQSATRLAGSHAPLPPLMPPHLLPRMPQDPTVSVAALPDPRSNGAGAVGLGVDGQPQHIDILQALMLGPASTLQQHLASFNEQLDWTNLYWENSGFPVSPYADMRMYPPS